MNSMDDTFAIFFAIWLILMGVSFYLFFFSSNAERKKKYFKPFLTATGLLILSFMWAMDLPGSVLAIAIPMVILIMYINTKMIRFCESCGKTVIPLFSFSLPRHCSHCGEKL